MRWQESCYNAANNQGKRTGPLKKHEFCDWQAAEACLTQLVHIQKRVDSGFVFLNRGPCLHGSVGGKKPACVVLFSHLEVLQLCFQSTEQKKNKKNTKTQLNIFDLHRTGFYNLRKIIHKYNKCFLGWIFSHVIWIF